MITSTRARDEQARKVRAERILDAASDLLLRVGYARVTIDDIAAQAGVGKGTVYLHWSTREELFYAVIMREQLGAVEEQLAVLRSDPAEAQAHRLVRWKFLTAMRRPVLRAVMLGDPNILGKLSHLARSSDMVRTLGTVSTDYFQALMDHGLLRTDLSMTELFYQMGSVVMGFFAADTYMAAFGASPDLERKADMLEDAMRRTFSLPPREEALQAVSPMVIELFEKSRDLCKEYLKQSYAAPGERTGDTA